MIHDSSHGRFLPFRTDRHGPISVSHEGQLWVGFSRSWQAANGQKESFGSETWHKLPDGFINNILEPGSAGKLQIKHAAKSLSGLAE